MQKKSQVGNAVPPILGRMVMEMVWKGLERTDEEMKIRKRRVGGVVGLPPAAVVNVDDEDEEGPNGGVGGDDNVIFAY